ncbi:SMP-30/gluconolactonase/LRE family protein [Qingshengfaniella alkalisoli]|uniref:SMP-30/gluconolactonase/LRE family protein n=1 Tax=Qingshengfaniella alkalisoli TaxID=2599296 RepID=A0A5B8I625_9RHOB|nr:SMP-30/gluconolactonase/LRE family protein [Qingshengfaniella alkalisoli]QDY68849.1 SMP-30/gluconolactonase/LRE family protein [Qingshengfaniella alkalisoli]
MTHILGDSVSDLGEGPLWHPQRQELFWFDILNSRLSNHKDGEDHHWQFDEMVSAAGWVDYDRLLIASERRLFLFHLETGEVTDLCPLEADNPVTRSNDGRADPFGGFWIGTMGKKAEPKAGSIYRYFKGELRKIVPDISITNAICFAPDGRTAYYADTDTSLMMRQSLGGDGWPEGAPRLFRDFSKDGINPDGAVVDADGNIWNAQWGAGRVACYSPEGEHLSTVDFPAPHTTCPAFGGEKLQTLFCTSATQGLSKRDLERHRDSGRTFHLEMSIKGQPEHQVRL